MFGVFANNFNFHRFDSESVVFLGKNSITGHRNDSCYHRLVFRLIYTMVGRIIQGNKIHQLNMALISDQFLIHLLQGKVINSGIAVTKIC